MNSYLFSTVDLTTPTLWPQPEVQQAPPPSCISLLETNESGPPAQNRKRNQQNQSMNLFFKKVQVTFNVDWNKFEKFMLKGLLWIRILTEVNPDPQSCCTSNLPAIRFLDHATDQ
jgi:hypothetical protein